MKLGRGSVSVLGTKTYPWNDPLHSASSALDQAIGRLDNRKCEICGAVGAECNKHAPKQARPKYEVIQVGEHQFVTRPIH